MEPIMQKNPRQNGDTEAGYSTLIPKHQRDDYAELIDALSIRVLLRFTTNKRPLKTKILKAKKLHRQ
jgi:hypothetical protein